MDDILEIGTVLQQVRQAVQRCRLHSDAPIAQQILLFNDSFYGYRFTTPNFTALWSAADQILKLFDSNGQVLEVFSLSEHIEDAVIEMKPSIGMETTPLTPQRRAA